jgi:hypothetical protein
MNLFRSEEHVSRWLGGREPGATISVTKLSELSHAWWDDRLDPAWQAVFLKYPDRFMVGTDTWTTSRWDDLVPGMQSVRSWLNQLPRDHGTLVPVHLERLFRCLDEVTKRCPRGCHKRLPLAAMIVHLNDDHRLSREEIAEWLTQESDG